MSKTLGTMTRNELLATVGKHLIVEELGGDILTGKLTNVRFNGNQASITVDEGSGRNTIWPTQWPRAVVVDMNA